jgi:hypothetical protein
MAQSKQRRIAREDMKGVSGSGPIPGSLKHPLLIETVICSSVLHLSKRIVAGSHSYITFSTVEAVGAASCRDQ